MTKVAALFGVVVRFSLLFAGSEASHFLNRPFSSLSVPSWFWDTINEIGTEFADVTHVLFKLNKEKLWHFYDEYREATEELHNGEWDSLLNLSLEESTEVASWVVAQGVEYYRVIWEDPRQLPSLDVIPFVDYSSNAAIVYREKFGGELLG